MAFSGGCDSTVLLHVLAALRPRLPAPLRAVHVNHGLHPDAGDWQQHCRAVAATLGVEYQSSNVTLDAADTVGVEAAAREVRYRALRGMLDTDNWLLTAHHADDQLETVLLQLMRGAGPAGLAAMPALAPFGAGWLMRPLLDVEQTALRAFAEKAGLVWCDDPGNDDQRFDRNYLRAGVMPVLKRRWPAAVHTASRSAHHCAQSVELLHDLAAIDLAECAGSRPDRLSLDPLRQMRYARQANLVRYWITRCELPPPNTAKLKRILHDVLSARCDAAPHLAWRGGEVRRYRDYLYAMSALADLPGTDAVHAVTPETDIDLDYGLGRLRLVAAHGAGLSQRACAGHRLYRRFRRGGEGCHFANEAHRKPLKKLFQERAIVPWMRARVPLIFVDDVLAAVAGIGLCRPFAAQPDEPGWRIVWNEHPPLH